MSYGLFRRDSEDNTVFYPWGVLRPGYIVNSKEKRDQISVFFTIWSVIVTISLPTIYATLGLWYSLSCLAIACVWYAVKINKIISGLPLSKDRLTVLETSRTAARSIRMGKLILLDIVSLIFFVGGLWMHELGENSTAVYFSMVFGVLGLMLFSYMIVVKLEKL